MADLTKFEKMLELLINEDKEAAEELFHEIVVEKSRDIYESLLEDDEEVDEATDEEVDESDDEDLDESDDEDLDESDDEDLDESDDDEAVEEGFDLDEFEVEADPVDDMMGDLEMGGDDDEEGDDDDMDMGDEEGDEELEDRVMDLEDALEDLKAEFEKMMGDDEGEEDDDEGEEEPEEEAFAFESDDEEVDEATDEEVDESDDEEVEEGEKTASETMREYVEKVSATMGDTGTNGTKSAVAGKNDMGGTASNIAQSKDEKGVEANKGNLQGSALSDQNPKDMSTGNVNVPGGKAGKTGFKKSEPGHGAEKKGKPETADKAATSTLNKVSTRAK